MEASSFIFLILNLHILFSLSLPAPTKSESSETDLLALISFKSLVSGDPLNVLSSWNNSVHHCQWPGVRCGGRNPDRVTSLVLNSSHLSEYGMGAQASVQGDMYSYGILLLEIFTGVSPTDEQFVDAMSLPKLVELSFPENVMEIVDHKLNNGQNPTGDYTDELDDIHQCLLTVIQSGLMCSKELPSERMDIHDVVKELNSAKEKLRDRTNCVDC